MLYFDSDQNIWMLKNWMPMKITNLEKLPIEQKGKLPSDENKNHKGKLPSLKRNIPIIENNKNKGYKRIIQRF